MISAGLFVRLLSCLTGAISLDVMACRPATLFIGGAGRLLLPRSGDAVYQDGYDWLPDERVFFAVLKDTYLRPWRDTPIGNAGIGRNQRDVSALASHKDAPEVLFVDRHWPCERQVYGVGVVRHESHNGAGRFVRQINAVARPPAAAYPVGFYPFELVGTNRTNGGRADGA